MTQTIDLRKKETPAPKAEPITLPEQKKEMAVELAPPVIAPPEPTTIRWSTHLSPPHRRRQVLYITLALGVSAALIAYFTHDFLFTIVLVLSAIVLNLNATRPRRQSEITIQATGISVDDQYHHYADMKSFWIDYQPDLKELSVVLKKAYVPRIKIPLADANPLEIRRAVISYVPEKEHEQSLLDQIIRLIGI